MAIDPCDLRLLYQGMDPLHTAVVFLLGLVIALVAAPGVDPGEEDVPGPGHGNPTGQVTANVLFIHGDRDPTCDYNSARRAYEELPAPKAFLTHVGADHGAYLVPGFRTYP